MCMEYNVHTTNLLFLYNIQICSPILQIHSEDISEFGKLFTQQNLHNFPKNVDVYFKFCVNPKYIFQKKLQRITYRNV